MSLIDLSVGRERMPFIDEGDGLTSERERVRMLLSLVAYAGGYKMMVGAHNIVHYYRNELAQRCIIGLRGGHCFCPPR